MDDIVTRLKKVSGHIQAAKAALDKTCSLVLNNSLKECVNRQDSENMDRILKLISKKQVLHKGHVSALMKWC